ncbi:MAG: aminotransferase class V-fold PLP-dependent enzyme [Bacteroidota bacterium]
MAHPLSPELADAPLIEAFDTSWTSRWGDRPEHPALQVSEETFEAAWSEYTEQLMGNYPFFHPRYAGQMLKPPHPVAVRGYEAAMRINPNNHALDGGPPTSHMEKEVMQMLAGLFDFPGDALGHLTSSGTIANLEALWIGRCLHPDKGIAHSEEAHYTHGRMAEVLGMAHTSVPVDGHGRLDLDALERLLQTGSIGTVVATPGTTGLGVVDPIAELIPLARRYGARVHIDGAYGGFFRLLLDAQDEAGTPMLGDAAKDFEAIHEADSVVVDPHKHGLQPYGCGAVLFRDPSVGRFYKHDSPYTYFTSADLHLGEISLECSRAGAAAGALWLTLRCLPLAADDGLGPILAAGIRAARDWSGRIDASDRVTLYQQPDLDIVTFFPTDTSLSAIDRRSSDVFDTLMNDPNDPIFLSLFRQTAVAFTHRHAGLRVDQDHARLLRSVLMKPEHERYVTHLHRRTVETIGKV